MSHPFAFRTRLAALFGGLILATAPLAHARVEPTNASGDTAIPAPALHPATASNPPKVRAKAHASRKSTSPKPQAAKTGKTAKAAKAGQAKTAHAAKHGTAHASAKAAPRHGGSQTMAKAHGSTARQHQAKHSTLPHHAKAHTPSIAKTGSGQQTAHHRKTPRDKHAAPSHA